MKLLFDQNLSFKLCSLLADLFPSSSQVRLLGLDQAKDTEIWWYAGSHQFVIVTQDADYAELAAVYGQPPKLIWLRCGNQTTAFVENLIRNDAQAIQNFGTDPESDCLELG